MTLRKQWIQTETWVRMECDTILMGEHLMLPPNELTVFGNKMIKRFENMLRVCTGKTPINHPDVKLLVWIWLHLHPSQQGYISTLEGIESVTEMMTLVAQHPAVLEDMNRQYSHRDYWSTEKYVYLIHGVTPKSIVKLDREIVGHIYHSYYSYPVYAARNKLAIYFDGSNRMDVEIYISEYARISFGSPDRLVFTAGQRNWQITKGQWVWFSDDGELHVGGIEQVLKAQYEDTGIKLGFWVKPKAFAPVILPSCCEEIEI